MGYTITKLLHLLPDLCSPVAFGSHGPQMCPVDPSTDIGICPDAQAGQQCFGDGRQLPCKQSDAVLSLKPKCNVSVAAHKLTGLHPGQTPAMP